MSKRITVIDYTILGLIQENPLTGYRIRKLFEDTALGNFSSSPGTVYPAVNKLRKLGYLKDLTPDDVRNNPLTITNEGKSVLRQWLLKPIEMDEIKKEIDNLILRFGFMDKLVTNQDRLQFIQSFRSHVSQYLKELQAYHEDNAKDFPVQAQLAFQHGLATYSANLIWARKAFNRLKNI